MFRSSIALCLVLSFAVVVSATTYNVTNIGNLGYSGEGYAIAAVSGQLAVAGWGTATSGGATQAFVWTQSGGIVNLQSKLQGVYGSSNVVSSESTGINSAGQVLGYYMDASSYEHAFLYNMGANTITNLDSWVGYGSFQTLTGINASGVFGGTYTQGAMPEPNGFYANTNTSTFTGVGAYGDPYGSTNVAAINNNGWLAGTGLPASGQTQAVEWRGSGTGWVLLPTFSGNNSYGDATYLEAIDSAGDAVGYTLAPSNKPIYYNYASNTMVLMNFASGHSGGKAFDINDNGLAVGQSNSAAFSYALTGPNAGTMYILNNYIPTSPAWNLQYAYAVDNSGNIVGYGTLGGSTDAYLLVPQATPEPATLSLAVAGLLGMAAYAWVRRRG